MKIKNLLFSVLVLFLISDSTANCQSESYHKNIALVNNYIFKGSYDIAFELLEETLLTTENNYTNDLIKYFFIIKKVRVEPSEKLIKKLLHQFNYDTLLLYKSIPKSLVNEFVIRDELYDAKELLNSTYSEKLLSIFFLDQTVRKENVSKGEIQRVDSINCNKFIALIRKYGFPHERNIGFYLNDSILLYDVLPVLFIHYQRNKIFLDFIKSYKDKDRIHPYLYSRLFDHLEGSEYKFTPIPKYITNTIQKTDNNYWKYFWYYTEDEINRINNNRLLIGLGELNKAIEIDYCYQYCRVNSRKYILNLNYLNTLIEIPKFMIDIGFKDNPKLDKKDYILDDTKINCNCKNLQY